jgi:hypothetical protein
MRWSSSRSLIPSLPDTLDDYWHKPTSNAHQSGYWLNPPETNFDARVRDICTTYLNALTLQAQGDRTLCLDEMTGIQALERKAADLPMRPGKIRRREFEYIRHGTQTLIASFDVAQILCIFWEVKPLRQEILVILQNG